MGNYKEYHKNVDNTKLPRMYPQPEYQIKTRAPIRAGNTWHLNILLKVREQELSDEAMPFARRKCYDPVMTFSECQKSNGIFWYVFNCQEQYYYLSECLKHEFNVQMDKKRRNMERNPEPWWHEFYDKNGEVGRQAIQSKDQEIGYVDSMKQIIFGKEKKN